MVVVVIVFLEKEGQGASSKRRERGREVQFLLCLGRKERKKSLGEGKDFMLEILARARVP